MSEIGDLLSMTLNQKSTDKITLEILIPTYKRPNSALDAVMTCLRSQDQRVAVFCHSNGFEPALEILRSIASNVHYDCFPENRGVHANFLKLLGSKRAKFVMLLSDEDRIDPKLLSPLLDFLDNNCRSDLVTCSVLNTNGTYYYNAKIHNANWMNANTGLIVDPFGSSYMSGWIYRTEELTDRVLKNGCRESMGKHIRISCLKMNY